MNLSKISLKELEQEIKRRKAENLSRKVATYERLTQTSQPNRPILAGEDLMKDMLVVVDTKGKAFAYPETPIIPNERRIAGYVIWDTKKGRRLRLRHWCFDDLIVG